MRPSIVFRVAGFAKPAGSKRGFYIKKINRVIITDACKKSKDWKTDVKHAAQSTYSGPLWDCPIKLKITFGMLRPKHHFRGGKRGGPLRDGAPGFPACKPDVLKLARAVEDALTGVIWADDCQIVREILAKDFSADPGALIEIVELPND